MRIQALAAGVAVAALIPSMALAQQTCEQRRANQTAGTVVGAGIGAILGSVVAGRNDRTAGAVVGGLGGAVVGSQVAKGSGDCSRAYGYYDNSGAWHASSVRRDNAEGYYDRQGQWVSGAPNGHYDSSGRWVVTTSDSSSAGRYDSRGRWVPASANGYYDNGRWVSNVASGYYDRNGRWVQGPATGRYDERGRWIPGQQVRADEVQPGYYDQGQWRPGPATGYYDARGRWIAVDRPNSGTRDNIDERQAALEQRIARGLSDGSLSRREADDARRALATIAREERALRNRGGNLRPRDEARLMARLDTLSDNVRDMRRGPVRQY